MTGLWLLAMCCATAAVQGGQKIRFSERDAGPVPEVADLKNQKSLAPEAVRTLKSNGDVAGDALQGQAESVGALMSDKKQKKLLEDRKNWLRLNREGNKPDQKDEEDDDTDNPRASKDDDFSDFKDLKRPDGQRGRPGAPSRDGMRPANPGMNSPRPEMVKDAGLDRERMGNGPSRIPQKPDGMPVGPSEFRRNFSDPLLGNAGSEREAIRKSDMDRFMNILSPAGARPNDGGSLGSGPAFRPAASPALAPPAVPSGPVAAPFSSGPRAFDPRPAASSGELSGRGFPSSGFSPGFNNGQDDPLRRSGPAPAVLPMPKRNF